MLDLNVIKARLEDQVPDLAEVVGVAVVAAVKSGLVRLPCAMVAPGHESAKGNRTYGASVQEVTENLDIVLAVPGGSDATGAGAQRQLAELSAAVRGAIAGWQPDADRTQFEFSGANPLGLGDGVLLWVERFRTTYQQRSL